MLKKKQQENGRTRARGHSVLRTVDIPRAEPLTVDVLREIEDDVRLIAVAGVARRYVSDEGSEPEGGDDDDTT